VKQAIAGVAPPELGEVNVMTVWPSIAAYPAGRFIGRLCMNRTGPTSFLTLGKLFALACIPFALALYFVRILPPLPFTWHYNRRYRLTNRRVVELGDRMSWRAHILPWRFHLGEVVKEVRLDQFDSIEVQVLPGQAWFPAGDLIFRQGQVEQMRISGVQRPETFRQTCLKAQRSHAGVRKAMQLQAN
jgi:hypothetical protein